MAERNSLAQDLDAAYRRFRQVLDRLVNSATLDQRTPAGWSAKEMLGHMGFEEEAGEAVIVTMIRDDKLPEGWGFTSGYVPDPNQEWPRADVHNAREAAWAHSRPAAEVIGRLDAAHERTMAVVQTFTPDEITDSRFRNYIAEKVAHYDEHRPELEALLGE